MNNGLKQRSWTAKEEVNGTEKPFSKEIQRWFKYCDLGWCNDPWGNNSVDKEKWNKGCWLSKKMKRRSPEKNWLIYRIIIEMNMNMYSKRTMKSCNMLFLKIVPF